MAQKWWSRDCQTLISTQKQPVRHLDISLSLTKLANLSELALLELWILTKILQQLEKRLGFPMAQW